jgi:hypothetical protein
VGEENDAVNKVIKDVIKLIGSLSKRPLESDGPEAGTALKMPRTDYDGERASTALRKRGGITLGDAGEGSSSNAKKTKQDSTSARTQGGGSTTLGKRDSSIECDEGGGSWSWKRIRQIPCCPPRQGAATSRPREGATEGQQCIKDMSLQQVVDHRGIPFGAHMNTTSSSRTRGTKNEGRDNHARAKRLNEGLQKLTEGQDLV